MQVEIRSAAFEPWAEVATYAAEHTPGYSGATACFVGTMRDFNDGSAVQAMTLEHYPGMTEKHLGDICRQAAEKWAVHDMLVLHRVGEVRPGDAIVIVAVWSAHRGDAQDACRFIIEDLKSRAPFWKQEVRPDGKHWVDNNTGGYEVRERKSAP